MLLLIRLTSTAAGKSPLGNAWSAFEKFLYFLYSVGSGPFSSVVRSQIHPWRV
jgi:hypothetical protein